MDPLSALASGITLAGLVKAGLEAFDLVRVARHQQRESKRLMLHLSLERARLYSWGRAMGLDDEHGRVREELRDSALEPLLRGVLEEILDLFGDGDRLQDKYGSAVVPDDATQLQITADEQQSSNDFAAAFSHFRLSKEQPTAAYKKMIGKTKWVFRDRQSFESLVRELRTLIDGLQDITRSLSAIAQQESLMKDSIRQIKDFETLSLVSEEFQKDYPAISEVASERADVVTLATIRRQEMDEWISSIGPLGDLTSVQESELEQLTITELQALTRSLLVQVSHQDSDKKRKVSSVGPSEVGTFPDDAVEAESASEKNPKTRATNDKTIEPESITSHQGNDAPLSATGQIIEPAVTKKETIDFEQSIPGRTNADVKSVSRKTVGAEVKKLWDRGRLLLPTKQRASTGYTGRRYKVQTGTRTGFSPVYQLGTL